MAHEKRKTNYHTGEVETVNDNFTQLYDDKWPFIREMMKENPTAVLMFTWLIEHMDRHNALVVSQPALAGALGVHRTTVHRATAYLKKRKAVDVFKSGNTNIYAVNAQIAWKSDANGKKFAKFDAAVYISDVEQDQPVFNTELVGHAKPKPKRKPKQVPAEPEQV